MKLLLVCQAVDANDPDLASNVQWIHVLARHRAFERITVLTLRTGSFEFPDTVEVRVVRGRNRLGSIYRFYREVLAASHHGIDAFFVLQGGPYAVMLLPFKLLRGWPIYQWQAHTHITPMMRFGATYCATKVFTPSASSFPLARPNVKVLGHGIDTRLFRPIPNPTAGDFLAVGRIAPVKRVELALRLVAGYNARYGEARRLDIFGPALNHDLAYRRSLESLLLQLGLRDLVTFHGPVRREELPAVYSRYRLSLSYNQGALDKVVLEAFACGLPVLTPNPCVAEILPTSIHDMLVLPEGDLESQIDIAHRVLALDENRRADLAQSLRDTVLTGHSLSTLAERLVGEMSTS